MNFRLLAENMEDLRSSVAPFKGVHLAKVWNQKTIPERAIVEPKFDGIRGILKIRQDGSYEALSRSGKPLHNVGHIAEELPDSVKGFVLDGEFVGRDWSSAVSAVRSSEKGDRTARFQIFDILPLDEFESGSSMRTLNQRKNILGTKVGSKPLKYSEIVKGTVVTDPKEIENLLDEFLDEGLEGAMLKDLDSKYEFKRSESWYKIKKFKSDEFEIIGVQPGKGKYDGMMGALILKGPKGKPTKVGTGFSDQARIDIWNDRDLLIGKKAEVKYQEITKDGSLRMPVFHRVRVDL